MSGPATQRTADEAEVGRLRTLYRLLEALSRASALEDVYDATLGSLLNATAANRAAILLFDDDGVIRFKASRGLSAEYQAAVTGHSPWPLGTLDAHPIIVPDVLLDERLQAYRSVLATEGIRALTFVPLTLDAGVVGKFMLYYSEPHECSEDELGIAQAIAAHVALATERKRAEFARIRSERRLKAVLDNSATVIFLKDLQGRYMLVNRRYEELFHLTQEEVIGRTDRDLFPAEVADQFQSNDRTVLQAGQAATIEETAPLDDGIHTYLSVKFPLEEPDGVVTGVCGIATDITDRKQLDVSSQRLAAIVESSDDAIIGKDLNGIITSWNRGAECIFLYTAAEVIGKPVSILAPPSHLDEMPKILSEIRQGRRVEHFETRRRRKDGEIIDVALTVSPVRDAAGRIVGASKIARDITERKRHEQEREGLLAREQEARRTAELLNRAAQRLAAQLNLEKLVQEVTDIATALVGAEFGAFFPNTCADCRGPEAPCTVSGAPRESLAGFDSTGIFQSAFRHGGIVRCEDGSQDAGCDTNHPYPGPPVRSYLAAPVVARSGELLGRLFFGHSVPSRFSEIHEAIVAGIAAQSGIAMDNARLFEQIRWAQTELKRSNEELRRVNQDLEVFAYSASHDLQEPLRTIALSAQLLERRSGGSLHEKDATFLTNILSAARRMSNLIQDLLAYTRATKSEEGPTPVVDAGRLLAGVLENLRGPIEEAGAVVTAEELPAVAIHESRLAQLFQNLISNAIKYHGEEAPRVHVAAEEREGWNVFSVVDNGIGIEPQFADQIFGLFKRLHSRDQYPGSGIGLAICQRVVEQYGGRIWLEQSAPGRGSTFCFAIPARA
jgi:PAS domain S-box-containing protein